jgi:hypothetical protein
MTRYLAHVARFASVCAFLTGNAFAAATMPAQFVPDNQPTGWVGQLEFTNGGDFSIGSQCLFKTDYNKSGWMGNVYAIPVDQNGNVTLGASCWDTSAGEMLDAQVWTTRSIGTMKANGSRIPFQWASLDPTQQSKLGDATNGPKMLNFVRGDRSNEVANGGTFRTRSSVLGDIIHSRPLYVYDAANPRLYVGANDGMLHVFDATTLSGAGGVGAGTGGAEVYAYIPSFLIPNLKLLASTTTPYPHQYFVDGTPNARRVTIGGVNRTVLVGGIGPGGVVDGTGNLISTSTPPGGTGLFALDITDPTAAGDQAAADKILWEITNTSINNAASTSYQNLGFTYGVPLIVKLNDGNWAAVVGNGYAQANAGTGQAYLYVINLANGQRVAEIKADIGGAADDNHPNGLSTPAALDVHGNGDGRADYVYAGDLAGNLWKFDFRNSAISGWSPPSPIKLFATPNATTVTAQAITGAPSLAPHPNGGVMVMFGTGRIFTNAATSAVGTPPDDQTSTTQQYLYGLWDQDFPAAGTNISRTIDPTRLVDQTLSANVNYTVGSLNEVVRTSGALNAIDYTPGTSQKQGWRLLLANNGERVVGDGGFAASGRYHVSTSNPNFNNGNDTNGNPLPKGDNWLIEVDYLTGMAPKTPIFDLNLDSFVDSNDLVADQCSGKGCTIPVARRILGGGVMSQPLLAQLDANSETYFNYNPDVAAVTNPGGVQNGHFDFDIYYNVCVPSSGGYKCPHNTHVHQYDDKYNVTGVDMQNASLTALNLVNAIPGTATRFKILVANQRLSPAVNLKVGDANASYVPVVNFQTPTDARGTPPALGTGNVLGTNTPFSDWLPTYTRKGSGGATELRNLYLNMPLDAFAQRDWVNYWATKSTASCDPSTDANCQVGLVPTQTGCVHANTGGFTDSTSYGPYGNLWMNGALTIQIIKDTTPDSAIRLESTSGDPKFGYRLKSDATSQANQLAQYTIFWHHPNGKCYGDAGWGTTAAIAYPDKAGLPSALTPAPGSDDPADGSFTNTGGGTTSGGTQGGTPSGTGTQITLPDGTVVTQYVVVNKDGSTTVTIVGPDGTTTVETLPPGKGPIQGDARIRSGRQAWKPVVRP